MEAVLPAIRSKIIVDDETRNILPLLNLDAQNGERP
jgi:membrane protease subunit HflK